MLSRQKRQVGPIRVIGGGIIAGVLGIVSTILVAASTANILSEPTEDAGTLVAVVAVAFVVGLGLGIRYRARWLSPTLVAGGLMGAFLFLRGLVFLADGTPISYPLLFGLPGALGAIIFALGGGWFGNWSTAANRLASSQLNPLTRAGLSIAVGWTVIELLFGLGMASTVGALLDNTFVGVLVATIVGFPVATMFAVWYGHNTGIDRSDWGYTWRARSIGIGLIMGAFTVLAVYGIAFVSAVLVGTDTAGAAFGFLLGDLEAGFWVVALFAVAHGIIAPITEELAWRGITQSALTKAEGASIGIVVTAIVFTTKHALVDMSLSRVPTVLVLALVLGIVRHQWGTTASTVTHAFVNLTSVALLSVYVLG